jgi:hypothetical protein
MRRNRIAGRISLFEEQSVPIIEDGNTRDRDDYDYTFTTSDGEDYVISFEDMGECDWGVSFAFMDQTDRAYGVLGGKKAFEVMQKVVNIIRQFFASQEWESITFTSNAYEESRTSLYKKIIERLGMQYAFHPAPIGGSAATFYIENPKFDGYCKGERVWYDRFYETE